MPGAVAHARGPWWLVCPTSCPVSCTCALSVTIHTATEEHLVFIVGGKKKKILPWKMFSFFHGLRVLVIIKNLYEYLAQKNVYGYDVYLWKSGIHTWANENLRKIIKQNYNPGELNTRGKWIVRIWERLWFFFGGGEGHIFYFQGYYLRYGETST